MGTWAHAGLALATSVGAWVNALILAVLLWRSGRLSLDSRLIRMAALALAASFALAAVITGLEPFAQKFLGLVPAVPELAPVALRLAAGGAVYLAILALGWKLIVRKQA
jgi:putative peptidoglycan lipid II flippase